MCPKMFRLVFLVEISWIDWLRTIPTNWCHLGMLLDTKPRGSLRAAGFHWSESSGRIGSSAIVRPGDSPGASLCQRSSAHGRFGHIQGVSLENRRAFKTKGRRNSGSTAGEASANGFRRRQDAPGKSEATWITSGQISSRPSNWNISSTPRQYEMHHRMIKW